MNENDPNLVKEIDKLYYRMIMFIKDYLTKVTAACPSRESLCLPHLGGQLMFKDRAVCTRLVVSQCTDAERRRFLRAFLRYELICKFYHFSSVNFWHRDCWTLTKRLRLSEIEAIKCMEIYLNTLYRAVLAQCSDSDLPESPTAVLVSPAPDVDLTVPIFHSQFGYDSYDKLTLNADELCLWLLCFGFDLAAAIVAGATAGQHGRMIIGGWFKNLAERGPMCGFDRGFTPERRVSRLIGVQDIIFEDKSYHEGSGLYQMLYTRLAAVKAKCRWSNENFGYQRRLSALYRSRAWTFFDDARLFKSQDDGPHFLVDNIVFPDIPFHDIIGPRRDEAQYFEEPDFSSEVEIGNLSRAITQAKSRGSSSGTPTC
ncbi:hypothetical protein RRF57_004783 [Xylaria bambusicola]|uniref:Uncharacterized protein n=1 Tax=Xylaria bambusicola TaxID=326684 RepID=A0AAN7UGY7_9PEZI